MEYQVERIARVIVAMGVEEAAAIAQAISDNRDRDLHVSLIDLRIALDHAVIDAEEMEET